MFSWVLVVSLGMFISLLCLLNVYVLKWIIFVVKKNMLLGPFSLLYIIRMREEQNAMI
jgi:hypothetical protein